MQRMDSRVQHVKVMEEPKFKLRGFLGGIQQWSNGHVSLVQSETKPISTIRDDAQQWIGCPCTHLAHILQRQDFVTYQQRLPHALTLPRASDRLIKAAAGGVCPSTSPAAVGCTELLLEPGNHPSSVLPPEPPALGRLGRLGLVDLVDARRSHRY